MSWELIEEARHIVANHPGRAILTGTMRVLSEMADALEAMLPEDDERRIAVYYYEHSCEWVSKFCDEHHQRSALVPVSVLAAFTLNGGDGE